MATNIDTSASGLEEKEMSSGSELAIEFTCQACLYEGKHVNGVWFCADCKGFLCDECHGYHRKALLSRGHLVKRKDGVSGDEMHQTVTDTCTELCKKHDGKVLEYYCFSHDVFACSACMTLDHKNCSDVGFIPNLARSEASNAEAKLVEEKLKKVNLQTGKIFDLADQNTRRSQVYSQQVMEALQSLRTRVLKSLDAFEECIRKELCHLAEEDSVKITDIRTSCSKMKQDIDKMESDFEAAVSSAMHCKTFCETKKCAAKIKVLEEKLREIRRNNYVYDVVLRLSEDSETIIGNIKSIGTLIRKTPMNSEIECRRDISVRTSSDKMSCKITGISWFSEGTLAVTDNNNANIKLINTSNFTITAELSLTSAPWGITQVQASTVATTLPEEGKVLIIKSRQPALHVDRRITVSGICRGLSYDNDYFAVSFVNPGKIEIIDMDGVLIRSFSTVFNFPSYSILQKENDHMFVSNSGNDGVNSVFSLTMDGDVLATYKDGKLQGPCAVVEENGFLYVCGRRSCNISVIDVKTGEFSKILGRKDGIFQPYSLLLDKGTRCLYVGMPDVDYIKMFEVC